MTDAPKKPPAKPAANHPWRQGNRKGVRQIARPSKGQIKRAMDFLAPAKP